MAIDLGDDDGWLDVQIRPAAGDPVTVRCDVYREHYSLVKLAQGEAGESEGKFLEAARDYFRTIGFPEMSAKATAAVCAAVNEEMAKFRAEDSKATEERVRDDRFPDVSIAAT